MSSETAFLLLKWLVITVVWLLLAIDLYRDRARLRKLQESYTITRLIYTLHKRNIQIYGLITMFLVVMAADDYGQSRSPTPAPEPEAAVEKPEPVKPAVAKGSPAFAIPNNPNMPFSNITEFNEKDSKQQAYIDFLKQRYETWLITYYYLQKCGKVGNGDFDLITGSLKRELDISKADPSVQNNIILAATGSFKEMYSQIPCDDDHVNKTKTGYDSTMLRLIRQEKPQLSNTAQPTADAQPEPAKQAEPAEQQSAPAQ